MCSWGKQSPAEDMQNDKSKMPGWPYADYFADPRECMPATKWWAHMFLAQIAMTSKARVI